MSAEVAWISFAECLECGWVGDTEQTGGDYNIAEHEAAEHNAEFHADEED